ncbi:hypothetical protein M408DRAFT_9166 [Serendipita vermifera MAFF 305830]|uniref:Uncharacterized protein n=1 Tax=Serendipita vermifera MAFF 305830 TaxID=933852 RepID=A0A0C2WN41_SERVB|nr:hypothetical protein M408DRAFT_9166 [Serendipita vermifera MAFF 305830]
MQLSTLLLVLFCAVFTLAAPLPMPIRSRAPSRVGSSRPRSGSQPRLKHLVNKHKAAINAASKAKKLSSTRRSSKSASDKMMAQMQKQSLHQMKEQTQRAIIPMITNINNGVAKVIKALGSAVKDMAG